VALKLMDTCGRRTLILWSAAGMFLCCGLTTAALLEVVPNELALLAVMGFVFFFEIGLGPIPWLIVAEMFDAKYVATAMSVSSQVRQATPQAFSHSKPSRFASSYSEWHITFHT
jgi:SP family facilitated glucose transporter-like MFS transporter 3